MNTITTICLLSLMTAGTISQEPSSTDVPDWVGEELPFDSTRYFTLPKQNAAPFYNLAFEEFTEEMYWQNRETNRAISIRERKVLFDKIYELFQTDPNSVESAKIDRVLKPYLRGLALLRIAQQHPECVFPINIQGIETTVISTHLTAAREVQRVLDLKTFRDQQLGDVTAAIEGLAIQLRLARDLRPRGDAAAQLTACLIEQMAFERIAPRILATSKLATDDCHQILEILVQHQQDSEIDPVLEAERYEQLFWHKLFDQLANEEIDPVRISAEYDLQLTSPTTGTVLVPLLEQIFNYEINPTVTRRIAQQLAARDPQHSELLTRINVSTNDELLEKLERMIAGIVIQDRLGSNRNVDFSNDHKILSRRYDQIAEVRKLTEPNHVSELDSFEREWAVKSNVSDTTLLELFTPMQISSVGRAEQRSRLLLRVAQCLTAVKHWELEHGKLPRNLKSATTDVGFKGVPPDPHNGSPIQLRSKDEPVIYASGADQKWPIPQNRKSSKRE